MPQVDVDKVRKSHRTQYVIVGAAMVLVVVAGLGIWYVHWRTSPTAASSISLAKEDINLGDYAKAETVLKSAYSRAIFTNDKVNILVWLAAAENDAGSYQVALSYYEQLNKLEPNNVSHVEMLAMAAQQAGNKQVELQADEETLPFLESTRNVGPTKAADISALQQQIAELKQ